VLNIEHRVLRSHGGLLLYISIYYIEYFTGEHAEINKQRRSGKDTMSKRRNAHQPHRSKGLTLPAFLIAAGVLIGGLLVYRAIRPAPGLAVADLGNDHIRSPQTATYNSMPPTSGPHYESLAPWGIHSEPIQNELQVHNLEDGGVIVQYNCPDSCPDIVAQLSRIVAAYDSSVILAPYPQMDATIALTAWRRIDKLRTLDEDRIVSFIEAYRGIDHHL
jgi:hypothetical protein